MLLLRMYIHHGGFNDRGQVTFREEFLHLVPWGCCSIISLHVVEDVLGRQMYLVDVVTGELITGVVTGVVNADGVVVTVSFALGVVIAAGRLVVDFRSVTDELVVSRGRFTQGASRCCKYLPGLFLLLSLVVMYYFIVLTAL